MLFITSVLVIAWGIMCITDRDTVWSMYQMDAQMFGKPELEKGPNWQTNMRYQGIVFMLLGIIGVMTTMGYTL